MTVLVDYGCTAYVIGRSVGGELCADVAARAGVTAYCTEQKEVSRCMRLVVASGGGREMRSYRGVWYCL